MSLEQVYQNDDISTILRKILREEIKEIGVFGEWLTKKDACRYLGGISMNTFDQAVVQSKIEKLTEQLV